jgi:hypothetical protein
MECEYVCGTGCSVRVITECVMGTECTEGYHSMCMCLVKWDVL